MSRKSIISAIMIGVLGGVFIFQPIVASFNAYNLSGKHDAWLMYLGNAYKSISLFKDRYQFFEAVLFGLFGAALMVKLRTSRNLLKLQSELQSRNLIMDMIQQGENQYVTFLPTLRWNPEEHKPDEIVELAVARTIAGFMNTHGGHLFIGVDDNGNPAGLKKDYQTLEKPGREGLRQYIMQVMTTILDAGCCPLLKIDFYEIGGRDICYIRVKPSSYPVYVHIGERAHFFVHIGSGTRELEAREALDYFERMLE
ncbi:ATP-binding protein [Pontibacter sp. 172403-2]|uniref:AlbA family DNA-binding domain-containing protein n=1 Tax=Pontibacter rufus TaxID=2791028 RepID=UPI0018AF8AFA|nr:ATP-binding protein [Pontibacter sp. 172403-2]MBF9252223.1 ATP-binding protein [Pontibacter sp. 172403-2]